MHATLMCKFRVIRPHKVHCFDWCADMDLE